MKMRFVSCVVLFVVAGCGQWGGLPEKTKKTVTAADAVGVWTYTADYGETAIALEIRNDGTFHQTVKPVGRAESLSSHGSWTLDGAKISLDKVLTNEGFSAGKGWVPEEANWYFVDNPSGDPPVLIFGGTHPDPDSWQTFTKNHTG